LTSKEAVVQLFSNTTWTNGATEESAKYLMYWKTDYSNVYMTLVIFIIVKVWTCLHQMYRLLIIILNF